MDAMVSGVLVSGALVGSALAAGWRCWTVIVVAVGPAPPTATPAQPVAPR